MILLANHASHMQHINFVKATTVTIKFNQTEKKGMQLELTWFILLWIKEKLRRNDYSILMWRLLKPGIN